MRRATDLTQPKRTPSPQKDLEKDPPNLNQETAESDAGKGTTGGKKEKNPDGEQGWCGREGKPLHTTTPHVYILEKGFGKGEEGNNGERLLERSQRKRIF